MKPYLVVFLLCLIVCVVYNEAKTRTLRRQNASLDLLAPHRPPPNPCRTILMNFANRKDLPQLSLCTGLQAMEGQADAFKIDHVYRWPSATAGCSKLSDPLFTMSAGCDTNAIWMFYVLTGHVHAMARNYCPKDLRQASPNTLVNLNRNWNDNLDAFELAIAEHKPRAYIFDEKGITHPYHYWIILQTPNKDGTMSSFEVISGFANSWRVIDWFRNNTNVPLPSYAGRVMTQADFKKTFLDPLKQMFTEVTKAKDMTENTKALYRGLWAVDGWGDIGKPILGIQYAPATQSSCQQYARTFKNVQRLSSARKWKGAAQAANIVSKSEALTRASKCKENSLCLGQYNSNNCKDDIDRL